MHRNPCPVPQSLSNIVVHLVFSTKYRRPSIDDAWRSRLHAYMSVIVRDLRCECYRAGGVSDHVHLAVRLSRSITVAELVEKLKTRSGKWLKSQGTDFQKFAWQKGYAAFSANPDNLEGLIHYISNQEEHHRRVGFQEEYRALLKEFGMPYDERYMWD